MKATDIEVRLRPFAGDEDIPILTRITNAAYAADEVQERHTEEQLRIELRPEEKFNPASDLRIAEVDGHTVGFCKVSWIDTNDGLREYRSWCEVDPAWRRRGIGSTLFGFAQARKAELSASHDVDRPRVAGAWAGDKDEGAHVLYEANGYRAVRWFYHMNRDLAQPIEVPPLPEGIEVRPVTRDDARQLFIADNEAFLDHFGGVDTSEAAFRRWVDESTFDPSLHVVAFDGDEIAGAVVNAIYPDSNAQLGVKHGWLDSVFTRRPWRRRGLARALVARSLVVLRDRGMTEGILGVDAGNETGALAVYTDNGFVVTEKFTAYRGPVDSGPMTVTAEPIQVPEAPAIPGLSFRRLHLPDDLEVLADLFNAANVADNVEDRNDATGLAEWFAHPSGYDPLRDCLIALVGDEVIGYGKVHWIDDADGGRNYGHWGAVHPTWRRRGLGRSILRANQRRLREIATTQDVAPNVRRFETWAAESQIGAIALLESEGFTVARYFFEMLRPNLDDVAEFPLPEGIEVRPMRPEHYRQVWDADVEAFADHWGGLAGGEEMFQRFFSGPSFEPDLWRVAWDGDQVAGLVSNVVMREYNEATGGRRGLLSGVSVRRPWRGRGLARALVSQSLVTLRDRGMTEAILGVDADNPTGALGVYEANGFVVHTRERSYRKPFEATEARN